MPNTATALLKSGNGEQSSSFKKEVNQREKVRDGKREIESTMFPYVCMCLHTLMLYVGIFPLPCLSLQCMTLHHM